jgi:phospholipid N-methyltransferase
MAHRAIMAAQEDRSRQASLSAKSKKLPLRQFAYLAGLLQDKYVASVAPSSQFLSEAICEEIDFDRVLTIVEFGAGEGSVTKALLERMRSDARLYAFETNEMLAALLRREVSDSRLMVIHDDAKNILQLTRSEGISPDVVVSGIPFSMFPFRTGSEILRNTAASINPAGKLLVYQAHIPPFRTTKRCRLQIAACFTESSTRRVYLNIPPLTVISARPRPFWSINGRKVAPFADHSPSDAVKVAAVK